MDFTYRKGLIWIAISIIYIGKRVQVDNCILDTGSATTAIDIDQIALNYNIPAKIKRLFGVGGGTQDVICQHVEGIEIGETIIPDIELEFGDLKGRLGINGFVGNDILSNFDVFIDFERRLLKLTKWA